jgi:hypothetical protein
MAAGVRLGRAARAMLLTAALVLLGILATARILRPDPRGYGTHTQLGLLPCAFRALTGYPCPSCGMTTAFAWVVRGRFDQAWRANPAASLLAPTLVAVSLWLMACAAAGRPAWGARSIDGPLVTLLVVTVTASLLAWTVRLAA